MLNIELRPNARLEEVVVTASERDRLSVNNTLMGTMGFSQKTIKATPTLFGESDIVQTLQLGQRDWPVYMFVAATKMEICF